MAVARTALCLDDGAWIWHDGEDEELPNELSEKYPSADRWRNDRVFLRFMSEPYTPPFEQGRSSALERFLRGCGDVVVAQLRTDDADLARRLVIGAPLGSGGHSQVHACTLKMHDGSTQRLAIKLSRYMLEGTDSLEHAQRRMESEFAKAERVLEPPEAQGRGRPAPPMDRQGYWRLLRARCEHASHVGYGFLHRLVHLVHALPPDGVYACGGPAILSEQADGTLDQLPLEARGASADGVSDDWACFAWQLVQAVDFMRTVCKLCHMDIKPENVLLRGRRCMLADYETCYPLDERAQRLDIGGGVRQFAGTTATFGPLICPGQTMFRMCWSQATCGQVADFACLSTLLELIAFPNEEGGWWTPLMDADMPTVVSSTRRRAMRESFLAQTLRADDDSYFIGRPRAPPRLRLLRHLLHFGKKYETYAADQIPPLLWQHIAPDLQALAPPDMVRAETARAALAAEAAREASTLLEVGE